MGPLASYPGANVATTRVLYHRELGVLEIVSAMHLQPGLADVDGHLVRVRVRVWVRV